MSGIDGEADGARGRLAGQTVVVVGGSAGIGLETARQVRADGGDLVLVARDPGRLKRAAEQLNPLVTAGSPSYTPIAELDLAEAGSDFGGRIAMVLAVARASREKVRPGGTLLFIGGTGGRRPALGMAVTGAVTAALPALTANLALEIAPVRVNLIAAGFVDTPLSASLLGDQLDARREELRKTLPIGRVVGPEDVAALALHIMVNDALTGATYDIDGGQQLVAH